VEGQEHDHVCETIDSDSCEDSNDLIKELSVALNIPIIKDERKYWLVRTKSGLYYESFISNKFVGLGWNKIGEDIINNLQPNINSYDLKDYIKSLYPTEKRPGLVAGYIENFYTKVKKGDIILIPDKKSRYIAFGEIIDDAVYYEDIQNAIEKENKILNLPDSDSYEPEEVDDTSNLDEGEEDNSCPYIKRRGIKLLKTLHKSQLDIKLLPALNSHNALSNLEKYSSYIDRTLNDFFIKDNEVHFLLNITKQSEITFGDYVAFTRGLNSLIDEFNSTFSDYTSNINDMEMKINVESPGIMELISKISISPTLEAISPVLIIGVILVSVLGGKISFATFNFECPGLMPFLIQFKEFLDKGQQNQLESSDYIQNAIESLEIDRNE